MINSCETGFSHVFICFHTPNSPSSYIKLHQATSTYRYRAQLHHARLTFLQQLQNAAGSRSTFCCRGNGTPTVGPFTWSARCSGMLWAIMAIMGWLNMLNIFKHIQTYSNHTTFKHFIINIGHHWTTWTLCSLCSWSLAKMDLLGVLEFNAWIGLKEIHANGMIAAGSQLF